MFGTAISCKWLYFYFQFFTSSTVNTQNDYPSQRMDLTYCFYILLFCSVQRLSEEMVSCIAVEAISILEQLHIKGYFQVSASVLISLSLTLSPSLFVYYVDSFIVIGTAVLCMETLSQKTF